MELKINGYKIFAPLKNKELVLTPEERVRQEYICRLVNHSGYDLSQMEQEFQVTVRFSLPSTLPHSALCLKWVVGIGGTMHTSRLVPYIQWRSCTRL